MLWEKKMKVLSLFDGISCGHIALEKVGIPVEVYYASEIDKHTIQITQKNYPNTIQLGDVTKWKDWNIDWSSIDLLIGGSPCQGFSFAGKMLNFDDDRSKLFFVYVDILNHIKQHNPNVKFLLENVKMKQKYQDVITKHLNVTPIRINSELVSAAKRDRLYWSNIENITIPEDRKITFDDIKEDNEDWLSDEFIQKISMWKAQQKPLQNATHIGKQQKLPVLTARGYNQNHSGMLLITDGVKYRYLTNTEAEKAMTVPVNYTEGISNRERARCLGNGWTVDVIAHIFKGLK